jgi:ankyrin repeat protein
VTNLDFVEYLLEVGADPNAQDRGTTPLMGTILPRCAKLPNWPTTDANIPLDQESFLAIVGIIFCIDEVAPAITPTRSKSTVLQQWLRN